MLITFEWIKSNGNAELRDYFAAISLQHKFLLNLKQKKI